MQSLANDKSCIAQWMAQKNISAFMPLIMSIFLRKKVSYYWHAFLKKLLLFKSVSESVKVTQVYPAALETMVSQPIAADSDLDTMNAWCGARTLPPSTWKENKVPLRNTTHGCTVSLTRLFVRRLISAAVWEKSEEKKPKTTCSVHSELRFSVGKLYYTRLNGNLFSALSSLTLKNK